MLPPKNRLLSRRDFLQVKGKGEKFQGDSLTLITLPTQNGFSRFGFIVSLRCSKKATERNKVKRTLREAVRQFLPCIKPGFDLVFLARKKILDKSFMENKTEIEKIFLKAELFNQNVSN